MAEKTYHHENLKETLITKAIEIISTDGLESLSMRSLALACGVSRQAPYNYFSSKEDMLQKISDYFQDIFANYLLKSIEGLDRTDYKTLVYMGYAYIEFFRNNPLYYDFIFSNGLFKIEITLDEVEGNFKPFDVFRGVCVDIIKATNMPNDAGINALVRCWSLVHGAALLVSSNNVVYTGDWNEVLKHLFEF